MPASGLQKDTFRYLMEDIDESSSANNINVMGISDYPESPHQVNKKAYALELVLEKHSPNQYRSCIGFNLHLLPVGYYMFVVECFPPEMNEASVTPQATTISISNHTTKEFANYTKTIIQQFTSAVPIPRFVRRGPRYVVSNRKDGCLRCSRYCF